MLQHSRHCLLCKGPGQAGLGGDAREAQLRDGLRTHRRRAGLLEPGARLEVRGREEAGRACGAVCEGAEAVDARATAVQEVGLEDFPDGVPDREHLFQGSVPVQAPLVAAVQDVVR